MLIDSNISVAVICEDCGKIIVEQLNLFKIKRDKQIILSCSCGSLNCIIYSDRSNSINLKVNCVYCGDEHFHRYKLKEFISGTELSCPLSNINIGIIGDGKDISRFIKDSEKGTLDVLFDEKFDLFFDNHNVMKESLLKLQSLKEDSNINCECGNEDISMEIFSDRIELKCTECESIKIIYAENQEDLNDFHEEKSINIKGFNFQLIDTIKNTDNN